MSLSSSPLHTLSEGGGGGGGLPGLPMEEIDEDFIDDDAYKKYMDGSYTDADIDIDIDIDISRSSVAVMPVIDADRNRSSVSNWELPTLQQLPGVFSSDTNNARKSISMSTGTGTGDWRGSFGTSRSIAVVGGDSGGQSVVSHVGVEMNSQGRVGASLKDAAAVFPATTNKIKVRAVLSAGIGDIL